MKHKLLTFFLAVNAVSSVALAATNQDGRAALQSAIGLIGTIIGLGILALFAKIGMFRGLKFRHYIFLALCIVLAMAAGFALGR